MGGIAGIIASDIANVSEAHLQLITDSLSHRGPDGQGKWISADGRVGLGHRRLAILDLTPAGEQPMHYLGKYSIVYDGAIYNYLELKDTLFQKGYRFQSQTDTEVILAAYDYWKAACVEHFEGMFAFALVDTQAQTLFAARDRFGEKPFYYVKDKHLFAFASEMKALWTIGIDKRTDDKMLLNYLTLGILQNADNKAQTFFEDIFSLPPGHYFTLDITTLTFDLQRYWHLNKDHMRKTDYPTAVNQLQALFNQSVNKRLRSNVALGCSFSGGVDSSAIVAAMQQQGAAFSSFSPIFPGFEKDASTPIQSAADYLSNKDLSRPPIETHFAQPSALGLIKDFETLFYHQEEPFAAGSIYAQFKVYELAKQKGVKVLLDAQGADQILSGHAQYIPCHLQQLWRKAKFGAALGEQKKLQQNNLPHQLHLGNYLAAFLPAHAVIHREQRAYMQTMRHPDMHPDFLHSLKDRAWEGLRKPLITKLNDILHYHTNTLGLEELLRFADRSSAAHGTELRRPFLSHELVQFVFSLPASFKINEGWTKWLLRKMMDQQLPADIVWRNDAVGYKAPLQQWMQQELLQDYMQEAKRKLVQKGILKKEVLHKKIVAKAAQESDNFEWRYFCAAQII